MSVSGEDSIGSVDFVVKKIIKDLIVEIIYITEGKQHILGIGVAQNLMQCQNSCDVSGINL
jgi:hypothetical protein